MKTKEKLLGWEYGWRTVVVLGLLALLAACATDTPLPTTEAMDCSAIVGRQAAIVLRVEKIQGEEDSFARIRGCANFPNGSQVLVYTPDGVFDSSGEVAGGRVEFDTFTDPMANAYDIAVSVGETLYGCAAQTWIDELTAEEAGTLLLEGCTQVITPADQ